VEQSFNVIPVAKRSTTFRADIQGLRAIAIILVIALHMNLVGFGAGFIGVDMFFAISGYVITLSLTKEPEKHTFANLAKFWSSRFLRIFPAAALVIAVTVLAAYFLQGQAFNSDLIVVAEISNTEVKPNVILRNLVLRSLFCILLLPARLYAYGITFA
jgi:peptidoglycan/LPS O-acetylase OafA/YrhL